ncbi:CaiB/BaiF CoA-transferase family protein [Parahaliea aestuarii]|uniref:CoA transferase n=1 Tax=Parahaliea aestuarii TaxID=1852021 RepID=A0A5C8ZNP5_9GAMM|nr:CoA transferase [Parahaliea aestuarii]TXS89360.1 CoA transferase [Parahaliea aestuarii]
MPSTEFELPLRSLRVLDLCDGLGASCGRYLADLGAEVVLVEPPGGSPARQHPPLVAGVSMYFATHAANKRSVVLDINQQQDREAFFQLATQADLLIYPRSDAALRWIDTIRPLTEHADCTLVTLAISDFGNSGPCAHYLGSNPVHMAMAGITARSGLKGREPLLPPGQLTCESASIQAAWVVLLGYWQCLHTGRGGGNDISVFEASCQVLDPALGVTGSAAGGQGAGKLAPRGRPPAGSMYPFFRCADGFVRICVLNPRQWQAMSDWLGDSHPFTDPAFRHIGKRFKHLREINTLIQQRFATVDANDLVAEGRRRGIPIAAVASPQQVLQDQHLTARGALDELEVAPGLRGLAPSGFLKINGERMAIRHPAPLPGTGTPAFSPRSRKLPPRRDHAGRRPLSGIRVLDLGVIVAGAELGRLFADQGATVIKIETRSYPDGLRQSLDGAPMTESFAQGNRGKKSLGLNLRSEQGKQLFMDLVAKSDVVMSNFKPGTMESLGFGYRDLKAINPRIIVSESSALGGTGPMSKSMGYGPLVRASSGLTGLWRYPDDEAGFGDGLTIFPDHLAARVSAVAIMSLLIDREHTGLGGSVSLSQAEAILMTLSSELLMESLEPGWLVPCGNRGRFDSPSNLFPCAGDDEWCAIDVQNNAQWQALCEVLERPDLAEDNRLYTAAGRLALSDYLEEQVSGWTKDRSPAEVEQTLQKAGIPSGAMARVDELPQNAHLRARNYFRTNEQDGLPAPLLTENGPAGESFLPDPDITGAPFAAQDTVFLMREILGLSDQEIDDYIAAGDLEVMESQVNSGP